MLCVVVGDNHRERTQTIDALLPTEGEVFVFDETMGTVGDLEQYLYPSLFMSAPPVIHAKYMLATEPLEPSFVRQLLASPTLFIFEEIELPAPLVTVFKKQGVVIHAQEKTKTIKKEADIFVVTGALMASDKKKRWMIYRDALTQHPIEAIMGILYWKVRDMALKNPKEKAVHLKLYRELLNAHARAWESGTPLELEIEKVLLMQ